MMKMFGNLFGRRRQARTEGEPRPDAPIEDAAPLVAEAYRLCSAGDAVGAERVLEEALARRCDCAEAHFLVGQLRQGRGAVEEAADAYTLATHYDPQLQKAWLLLGSLLRELGDHHGAIAALERAVALDGNDAVAINALGAAQFQSGLPEAAVERFREALRLSPDFADAHSNLGFLLFREFEAYDEGEAHIVKALELSPGNETFLCNRAMVHQQRGELDAALALCNELLARNPGLKEVRLNRGVIQLARARFAEGWADYEARDKFEHLPWPEWDGGALAGKSLLVYTEQGIGDEIMFASCLPEVLQEAASCTIACSAKVSGLLRRSFPGAEVVVQTPGNLDWLKRVRRADLHIAAGSIPRFRRQRVEDFPRHDGYLRADPSRVAFWREKLDALPGRLKVGLSWRGGAPTTRRRLRSIPLEAWMPMLASVAADFVSLQYFDCSQELDRLHRHAGIRVHDWREALDDYCETAALVSALDLVVSVQTAVVHLAGALGVPALVLIPRAAEWRYLETGSRMPWYPSVQLFRQRQAGDWTDAMEEVAAAVRREADERR